MSWLSCGDCEEDAWYAQEAELKQLRFEVRRAESFYKDWKAIAEELMVHRYTSTGELDKRIANLYQLEKEVAEGL